MPEVHATNGTVIAIMMLNVALRKLLYIITMNLEKNFYHQLPVKRSVAVLERMKQEITT